MRQGELSYIWTINSKNSEMTKEADGLRASDIFYANAIIGRPAGHEDMSYITSTHAQLSADGVVGIYLPVPKPAGQQGAFCH